jgi:hypothetical protein
MAGLKQEDEEVNCSMRLNKKRHVVVMWQIIDTFKKSVANHKIFKTVKSCREVEKARRHDEEYCDGSALPRHDPSKEKQMVLILSLPKPGGHVLSPDFGQINRMSNQSVTCTSSVFAWLHATCISTACIHIHHSS